MAHIIATDEQIIDTDTPSDSITVPTGCIEISLPSGKKEEKNIR